MSLLLADPKYDCWYKKRKCGLDLLPPGWQQGPHPQCWAKHRQPLARGCRATVRDFLPDEIGWCACRGGHTSWGYESGIWETNYGNSIIWWLLGSSVEALKKDSKSWIVRMGTLGFVCARRGVTILARGIDPDLQEEVGLLLQNGDGEEYA